MMLTPLLVYIQQPKKDPCLAIVHYEFNFNAAPPILPYDVVPKSRMTMFFFFLVPLSNIMAQMNVLCFGKSADP